MELFEKIGKKFFCFLIEKFYSTEFELMLDKKCTVKGVESRSEEGSKREKRGEEEAQETHKNRKEHNKEEKKNKYQIYAKQKKREKRIQKKKRKKKREKREERKREGGGGGGGGGERERFSLSLSSLPKHQRSQPNNQFRINPLCLSQNSHNSRRYCHCCMIKIIFHEIFCVFGENVF